MYILLLKFACFISNTLDSQLVVTSGQDDKGLFSPLRVDINISLCIYHGYPLGTLPPSQAHTLPERTFLSLCGCIVHEWRVPRHALNAHMQSDTP